MFPAASDAVQVTVVVPTGKKEPKEAGEHVVSTTPILSVAVTLNVTATDSPSVDTTVMSAGTFTTGGVVSAGGV